MNLPSKCIRLRQTPDSEHRRLLFELKNTCDERLDCTVTWEVVCEGQALPDARSEQKRVEPSGTTDFEASASACGDGGWRISPAKWSCKTGPTNESATR